MNSSYRFHNSEERKFMEEQAIIEVIMNYLKEVSGEDPLFNDIFNKPLGFTLEKRTKFNDNYVQDIKEETISLYPMCMREEKIEIPYKRRYSFKERIKILLKGEL